MPPSLALCAILKVISKIKLVYEQWQHLKQTVCSILAWVDSVTIKKKRTQGFNSRRVNNMSIPRSRSLFS